MRDSDLAAEWTIEPRATGILPALAEAWRARSLLVYFAHRSAQQIIGQTVLGFAWLILRPAITLAVLGFLFGYIMSQSRAADIPYLVHLLYGMALWSCFDAPLIWATRGLNRNRALLKKLYFPRLVVPLASTFPGLIDWIVHMAFLALALLFYVVTTGQLYIALSLGTLAAIGALLMAFSLAVGVCLFTALWDYRARDTRYTLASITRFLLYATPVLYPASSVPPQFMPYYYINPMAGLVETFRYGMLGRVADIPWWAFGWSAAFALTVLICGTIYFCTHENAIIDRVSGTS